MAQFEGETVIMTLRQPPNTIVEGRVRKINVGSNNPSIELENVYFPGSGARWESWTAHSSNIANLDLAPSGQQQRAPSGQTPTMQQGPGGQQPQMQRMPPTHTMPMHQHVPQQHGGQQYQQYPQQQHASQMPMHHMQRPPGLGFAPPPMPMHMQRPPSASISPAPTPSLEGRVSTPAQQQSAPMQRPSGAAFAPAPLSMPSAQGPPLPGKQIQLPFATAQGLPPPTPPKQRTTFVDPAIMSIGRSPAQQRTMTPTLAASSPATPVKSALARAAEATPIQPSSPYIGNPTEDVKYNLKSAATRTKQASTAAAKAPSQPAPPQEESPSIIAVEVVVEDAVAGEEEAGQPDTSGKTKRGRRGIRNKNKAVAQTQELPAVMNVEVSRNGNDMNGSVKRGKGWRETPFLKPSPHASVSPSKNGKMNRRQRQEQKDGQNGWATEEATDIQDLGDFDFEASNTLFDKKTVFDELRQGDTTADEDRLVGHNRLPRPGTYGGKNYHPTENVLSPKLPAEEASSDADTEMNFHTGRSTSRNSVSKRRPSRQNSTIVDSRHPLAASMSSDRGMSRSTVSLVSRNGKPLPSPRPDRLQSPHSGFSSRPPASPRPSQGAHFSIKSSGAPCPVLLPAALETLEAETTARFGLTQDAITENAARVTAILAKTMMDPAEHTGRRESRTQTTRNNSTTRTTPVVVVLAGNHVAGARAVAAARHLAPRHAQIILAEAQYESAATQEEQMVKQTLMLKRMARSGMDVKRGTWRKAFNYIKNLPAPPAIIIDALLAGASYDSLVSPNKAHSEAAQSETREMIDWANRSRAPVLSIACPSGVSGEDGSSTILEGEPLAVRPDRILTLGAPMTGLLEAMKSGESWEVDCADIGVNIALKRDDAVAFGAEWVDGLRFVEE
jgi:enhancer of mRNA-decapping protein 3